MCFMLRFAFFFIYTAVADYFWLLFSVSILFYAPPPHTHTLPFPQYFRWYYKVVVATRYTIREVWRRRGMMLQCAVLIDNHQYAPSLSTIHHQKQKQAPTFNSIHHPRSTGFVQLQASSSTALTSPSTGCGPCLGLGVV